MASLVAVFANPDNSLNVHFIRELTSEQSAELDNFSNEFNKIRQRFSLLHVLDQNYATLNSFINELRTAQHHQGNRALSEANRHLMNYLSSGYALRQHLETSLKRDFGRKSNQWSKFQEFLTLLEDKCFEYAFLQDFRDFVQHRGFPIGAMNLTQDQTGRVVTIKHTKAALLKEGEKRKDNWKRCDLQNRPEEDFDLELIRK